MSSPNTQWLIYAAASGGCAALNGVFAKLTTTELTTTWATTLSKLLGLGEPNRLMEVLFRAVGAAILALRRSPSGKKAHH
jgi:uncharacterized membrane protein